MGFNSGQWLVDLAVEGGAWQVISPEAAVDLTLFPFLSVCLSLCLSLVVSFFFLAAIWVDLILVSNCGGWFAVEALLR